jgi:hypothetical protein
VLVFLSLGPDRGATTCAALQTEIRKLEDEPANVVAAIAIAGDVEALAQAIRDREQRRTHLRAELIKLERAEQFNAFDIRRVERGLRKRLADWRELLRRQAPGARQVGSGRIPLHPNKDERLYRFTGRVKFDQLLSGVVPTVGMVPVRGYDTHCSPIFSAKLAFETALRIAI